jgi:hypothetical protein
MISIFQKVIYIQSNVQVMYNKIGLCRSDLQEVSVIVVINKRYGMAVDDYLREKILPQVRNKKGPSLLEEIIKLYSVHMTLIRWLGSVFAYLVIIFFLIFDELISGSSLCIFIAVNGHERYGLE